MIHETIHPDHGTLTLERDGKTASLGYSIVDGEFIVGENHGDGADGFAILNQRMRQVARDRGFDKLLFSVDLPNEPMEKLTASLMAAGRIKPIRVWFEATID